MDRPLGSSGGSFYTLPHSGVVVTLEDGSTWLVHKGIRSNLIPILYHAWLWHISLILGVHTFTCKPLVIIIVGKDYSRGRSGCQAVVTDDRYMSSLWRVVDSATCNQRHRLGLYVQKAGCQYNLLSDNCWNAARRMMSLCRS